LINDPHLASNDIWKRSGKQLAANGAIMRTCILGVFNYSNLEEVISQTVQYAKVTHYDPRCIASCVAITSFISFILRTNPSQIDQSIIEGAIKEAFNVTINSYLQNKEYTKEYNDQRRIRAIEEELEQYMFKTRFSDLRLDEPDSIGYTFKSMGSAFTSLRQSGTIESILNDLIMEGGDADSNACVAGALLGCVYGYDSLPKEWLEYLPHRQWLENRIYSFIGKVID
jgi:ADP-ribosylglycohydrolase